jgi:hypothetical protein
VPIFTPPTTNEGIPLTGHAPSDAIRRIVSPLVTGNSLYKLDGVWHQTQYPSNDVLEASSLYYLGGHEYDVDQSIIDELLDAGFDIGVGDGSGPTNTQLYPGAAYPGPTTYPGVYATTDTQLYPGTAYPGPTTYPR